MFDMVKMAFILLFTIFSLPLFLAPPFPFLVRKRTGKMNNGERENNWGPKGPFKPWSTLRGSGRSLPAGTDGAPLVSVFSSL